MPHTVQNIPGISNMTEQVIATDFLIGTKSAIKNYAAALAETASPQVRTVLQRQFDAAVSMHEKIINYMMNKGYYHAYNPEEQINVDMKAANTVIGLHQQI